MNIPEATLGLITANALSTGLFGTNLKVFLTEGWGGKNRTDASNNSWEMTLGELLTVSHQGRDHANWSFGDVIKSNLSKNGFNAVASIVGTKIALQIMKQMGINKTLNKAIRSVGLGKTVKM